MKTNSFLKKLYRLVTFTQGTELSISEPGMLRNSITQAKSLVEGRAGTITGSNQRSLGSKGKPTICLEPRKRRKKERQSARQNDLIIWNYPLQTLNMHTQS